MLKKDPVKQREASAFADDAFARHCADIDKAIAKSEKVSTEKNRAAAVALIAEIRRIKPRLMEAVPKLQKSAKKVKGLSKGELQTRFDLVLAIIERIKAIRDGSTPAENQTGGCRTSSSNKNIKFDSSEECLDSGFYRRTEELGQFRQDYELRKKKQDEGLDVISEGLDMLKNIALDMNEELDRRAPLMDEIDSKVDQTTSDIRKNNVTLKQTITQIRSGRNFSIDITLLCIILGIAFYLNK
ncbi:syntaxin of plants 72 [Hibiscus trionum]|uniref:Syntaxin of plants 72 n=1 Tax=Hibiscus trionum TaxID=183268 RepID=A0A9W7MMK3_HIBTR|nr:syntaxin of plants 72 [Hibiscus trionum]